MDLINKSNEIVLKIDNVGPITNAKININKINIIGGKNSTGKSTSSKLLYSFLRANSKNNKDLANDKLKSCLESLFGKLNFFLKGSIRHYIMDYKEDSDLLMKLHNIKFIVDETNDFDVLSNKFDELYDIFNKIIKVLGFEEKFASEFTFEEYKILIKEKEDLENQKENLINQLNNFNHNINELKNSKEMLKKEIITTKELLDDLKNDDTTSNKVISTLNNKIKIIENKLKDLNQSIESKEVIDQSIKEIDFELEAIKSKLGDNRKSIELNNIQNNFNEIKVFIDNFNENQNYINKEALKTLIQLELDITENNQYGSANLYGYYANSPFECNINFKEHSFEFEGLLNIEEVFYIDSFSIFDFRSYKYEHNNISLLESDHFKSLEKALFETKHVYQMFDEEKEDYKRKSIMKEEIKKIIGGEIIQEQGVLKFIPTEGNYSSSMKITASGVKQFAIVQTLFNKDFLKPNSFLIFDEPEVNMHPEWQLKLAEFLVFLAKEWNINLYINTHSPLFIEAIKTYSEDMGLLNDTNFYITKESDKGYVFDKLELVNLHLLYKELGTPYEILDDIKIMSKFKNHTTKKD